MNSLFKERQRFYASNLSLLNSGNWNPTLHPRNSIGEFRYNGGRHRRPTLATGKDKFESMIPPHPPNVDVLENMNYMRLLADEIGLYPAMVGRFYFLVRKKGIWDYQNQPSFGANPQYQAFGNFNYGAAGTAMGLDSYDLQNEGGIHQPPGTGKGRPGRWGDPKSGVPPYGDLPIDNYWIRQGIQYAHQHGY